MRKVLFILGGAVSFVAALLLVPTLLYNVCGMAELSGDCADGPKWVSALVALTCAIIMSGLGFLTIRLIQYSVRK